MDLTHGHLLGGRVHYAQPAHGFRSGIEPVLLAAAVPARPEDRVLEAGTGAGAALLCLAARVPRIQGLGVELEPELARLAAENACRNQARGLQFLAEPIEAVGDQGHFDHAMANPPYFVRGGSVSPLRSRETAKTGDPDLIARWITAMAERLKRSGSLSVVLPAEALTRALGAMASARCAAVAVLPLWPRAGRAAKLVLVRGRKESRAPLRLLAGMVLHSAAGTFTAEAEAILRGGAGLEME